MDNLQKNNSKEKTLEGELRKIRGVEGYFPASIIQMVEEKIFSNFTCPDEFISRDSSDTPYAHLYDKVAEKYGSFFKKIFVRKDESFDIHIKRGVKSLSGIVEPETNYNFLTTKKARRDNLYFPLLLGLAGAIVGLFAHNSKGGMDFVKWGGGGFATFYAIGMSVYYSSFNGIINKFKRDTEKADKLFNENISVLNEE
ncbi:MAG: hypothetical protein KKG60_00095 [Nanoarchaeota archaeon]|nr:hypothetical protein [Nanoarchaeota archaeon]